MRALVGGLPLVGREEVVCPHPPPPPVQIVRLGTGEMSRTDVALPAFLCIALMPFAMDISAGLFTAFAAFALLRGVSIVLGRRDDAGDEPPALAH